MKTNIPPQVLDELTTAEPELIEAVSADKMLLFKDAAQAEAMGMVAVDPHVMLKLKGMTRAQRRAWVADRKRERRQQLRAAARTKRDAPTAENEP